MFGLARDALVPAPREEGPPAVFQGSHGILPLLLRWPCWTTVGMLTRQNTGRSQACETRHESVVSAAGLTQAPPGRARPTSPQRHLAERGHEPLVAHPALPATGPGVSPGSRSGRARALAAASARTMRIRAMRSRRALRRAQLGHRLRPCQPVPPAPANGSMPHVRCDHLVVIVLDDATDGLGIIKNGGSGRSVCMHERSYRFSPKVHARYREKGYVPHPLLLTITREGRLRRDPRGEDQRDDDPPSPI